MDLDPGGPKTYRSYGSGPATLENKENVGNGVKPGKLICESSPPVGEAAGIERPALVPSTGLTTPASAW
jgi:hypothetical protein